MVYYYSKELYHHGILGQKWGKRNGPPYPLGKEDYSKAERDAAKKNFSLSDKQKKYIKIGAALSVAALAAYGGYKLYQNRGMIRNYANLGKQNIDFIRNSGKFDYLDSAFDQSPLRGVIEDSGLKAIDTNESDSILLSNINKDKVGGNCQCCASAVLGRLFGIDVSAQNVVSDYKYDELMDKVFNKHDDDIKRVINPDSDKIMRSILRRGTVGDVGAIGLEWNDRYAELYKIRTGKDLDSRAHIFNYRIDSDGQGNKKVTFLDGQIEKDNSYIEAFMKQYLNSGKEASYTKIGNINDGVESFLNSLNIDEYKKFIR